MWRSKPAAGDFSFEAMDRALSKPTIVKCIRDASFTEKVFKSSSIEE